MRAKYFSVPRKYLPGVLSRSKYGLLVSVSQLVLGLIMLGLAVWRMMIQEQMTLVWDWPLYSGVACLWSGWVGVWLICCCRYYYPPYSQQPGSCVFPINSFSIVSIHIDFNRFCSNDVILLGLCSLSDHLSVNTNISDI